ncbi:MAG: HPr family phosphocarrier protein, partial [Phycisphaerales bacterium JB060]
MAPTAEHRFECTLANGLHARPASALAEAAGGFASSIVIQREDGESADMCSVLSVVGLDVQRGDAFVVRAEGTDAAEAVSALRA